MANADPLEGLDAEVDVTTSSSQFTILMKPGTGAALSI
jgi:hypothetical protein